MLDDLSSAVISTSHTAAITCVAFGSRPDIFATGDGAGCVKVWDLSDYATVVSVTEKKSAGVTCMAWIQNSTIVCGFGDSFVRCFDAATGDKLWEIPSAHKGPISSVAVHTDSRLAFVVTGGEDGGVRVWALKNRELMIQFVEHTKGIAQVSKSERKEREGGGPRANPMHLRRSASTSRNPTSSTPSPPTAPSSRTTSSRRSGPCRT
jgi:WD40 repeat protein